MNDQTLEEGLKEIDNAIWKKGDYDELNLIVHSPTGKMVHCWLTLRQPYCDRGHIQFNVEISDIDDADSFPRYFMNQIEAKQHVKSWLKWRLWKHRTNDHVLTED